VKRNYRVCRLFDIGSIETEYHVFIACGWYEKVRVAHQFLVSDLHDLFRFPLEQLGLYIMALDRKQGESIAH
jgi:hypothetical protein